MSIKKWWCSYLVKYECAWDFVTWCVVVPTSDVICDSARRYAQGRGVSHGHVCGSGARKIFCVMWRNRAGTNAVWSPLHQPVDQAHCSPVDSHDPYWINHIGETRSHFKLVHDDQFLIRVTFSIEEFASSRCLRFLFISVD